MANKTTLKIIYLLNRLACRTLKEAENRVPLDDSSPRYYSLTTEEENGVAVVLTITDSRGNLPAGRTCFNGWRVVGWRGGTLHIRRGTEPPGGWVDSPPHASPSTTAEASTQTGPSLDLQIKPVSQVHGELMLPVNDPAEPPRPLPSPLPQRTTTPTTSPPPLPSPFLSKTPLTRGTLKLLLATFDHVLPDTTRYIVSGHAALMVWGYYNSHDNQDVHAPPSQVSIVCPAADRDVILTRASAVGWSVYYRLPLPAERGGDGKGGGGEVIGVPVLGLTGEVVVWGFRLRVVGDGEGGVWDQLGWVRPVEMATGISMGSSMFCVGWIWTVAPVLGVPALLNEFARAWYFCVVKGRGGGGGEREKRIGEMILWLLRRLAEDAEVNRGEGRRKLTPRDVPCVVYGKFWDAFVERYHAALGLLERVGLYGPGFAIRNGAATLALRDTW